MFLLTALGKTELMGKHPGNTIKKAYDWYRVCSPCVSGTGDECASVIQGQEAPVFGEPSLQELLGTAKNQALKKVRGLSISWREAGDCDSCVQCSFPS